MKFPKSQVVGLAKDAEGRRYTLHFYGEDEGAAVVTGPSPDESDRLVAVPERHREDAATPQEARAKLSAWCVRNGMTLV